MKSSRSKKLILLFISTIATLTMLSDEYRIMFCMDGNVASMPVEEVDSITFATDNPSTLVMFRHGQQRLFANVDSVVFDSVANDTLRLRFTDHRVYVYNPKVDSVDVLVTGADVEILSQKKDHLVIAAEGKSDDGRIRVVADTVFTLCLKGLHLSSGHAPAINSCTKQKMIVELEEGTENVLRDGEEYFFNDSTEKANACLCSQGHIDFKGSGSLAIYGNQKHGIASDKGIRLMDGHISVLSAPADGINADKYISVEGAQVDVVGQGQDGLDASNDVEMSGGTASITVTSEGCKGIKCEGSFVQSGGTLHLTVEGNSCKGIKAKGTMTISDGALEATATGDVVIKDGDPSFCTILKCDSDICISGGDIRLVNRGQGGKCVSCDTKLTISGGEMYMETTGDGAEYVNADSVTDYYTPKCVAVDDSLFIVGGQLHCVSTGLGGKGVVAGQYLAIGNADETEMPNIRVETKGTCIWDDIDEDKRHGCPKGIKADERLDIFGGNILVCTEGQGGEGMECNNEMYIYGGTLECNTYDDGINVGNKLEIEGGCVYCNSVNNDGIDSNGSVTISGGIVASVNQAKPNESIDAEDGQIFLWGGTVFGIGSGSVSVAKATNPCYSTPFNVSDDGHRSRGLILTQGKYVYVMRGDEVIMALRNDNGAFRSFVTVMSASFNEDECLTISEGDPPIETQQSYWQERLIFGGAANTPVYITDIQVQTIKQ